MKVLVSGASSGLGKFLAAHFTADAFDRAAGTAPQNAYDLIVHCAFNTGRAIPSDAFPAYVNDTIGLTERLLAIPHGKFVFVSTVDVYPPHEDSCHEDTTFDTDKIESMYGRMKLVCESLVADRSPDALILRPTAMLGPFIRRNSLLRLLFEDNPALSLSASSVFNYILHTDIAAFTEQALTAKTSGIVNLAAAGNVTLQQVCDRFSRRAQFGSFAYRVNTIDNARACTLHDGFKRESLENIAIWLEAYQRHTRAL